jgi:hypothetical protein
LGHLAVKPYSVMRKMIEALLVSNESWHSYM